MEQNQYDLLEVLSHIEPAGLDYQQWVNVGMALEIEGYGVEVWEAWSRKDPAGIILGNAGRNGPASMAVRLLSPEGRSYSMQGNRGGRRLMIPG